MAQPMSPTSVSTAAGASHAAQSSPTLIAPKVKSTEAFRTAFDDKRNPQKEAEYTVKKGDTFTAIANKYGLNLKALIERNAKNIPNPKKMKVGSKVYLSQKSRQLGEQARAAEAAQKDNPFVVAKAGDSLSKIEKRLGYEKDTLVNHNKDQIANPKQLQIKQKVYLPIPNHWKNQEKAAAVPTKAATSITSTGPHADEAYVMAKPGETLSSIERRLGYKNNVLVQHNKDSIPVPKNLQINQKVYLPKPDSWKTTTSDRIEKKNTEKVSQQNQPTENTRKSSDSIGKKEFWDQVVAKGIKIEGASPERIHDMRVHMFGKDNTNVIERFEKVQNSSKTYDVKKFTQLSTADLSKKPVDASMLGSSGAYIGVLMNADKGGIDKAKSSKLPGVAKLLQKALPGTKWELYSDNLGTYTGKDSGSNEWGNLVVQIRADAIRKVIKEAPKPIKASIEKQIRAQLPKVIADELLEKGLGDKVHNKKLAQHFTLSPSKATKKRADGSQAKQLDWQHWNNARVRIGISARDLINSAASIASKNIEPGTEGMNALEKAFDSATVGLNYDVGVAGVKIPMVNGTNAYVQVRFAPQNIASNHLSGNKSGEEDVIFLLGLESGDANDFVKNSHENEKKRKGLNIPKGKMGAISRVLGKGIKALAPGTTAIGYNIQFKPNAAQVMVNPQGQRVYITNYDGKNIALPPGMTPIFDKFTAQDHVKKGHPPVKTPDTTFAEYMGGSIVDQVDSTGIFKKAIDGLDRFDAYNSNMEFVYDLHQYSHEAFYEASPNALRDGLSYEQRSQIKSFVDEGIKDASFKLLPRRMLAPVSPLDDPKVFFGKSIDDSKLYKQVY